MNETKSNLNEAIDPGLIGMMVTVGASLGLPALFKAIKKSLKDSRKADDLGRLLIKIDDKYPGGIKGLKTKMENDFEWNSKSLAYQGIMDELSDYVTRDELDDLRFINNFFHANLEDSAADVRTGGSIQIPMSRIAKIFNKYANKFNVKPIKESKDMMTFEQELMEAVNKKKIDVNNIENLTNKDIKTAIEQAEFLTKYAEFRQDLVAILRVRNPEKLAEFVKIDKKAETQIQKMVELVSAL